MIMDNYFHLYFYLIFSIFFHICIFLLLFLKLCWKINSLVNADILQLPLRIIWHSKGENTADLRKIYMCDDTCNDWWKWVPFWFFKAKYEFVHGKYIPLFFLRPYCLQPIYSIVNLSLLKKAWMSILLFVKMILFWKMYLVNFFANCDRRNIQLGKHHLCRAT